MRCSIYFGRVNQIINLTIKNHELFIKRKPGCLAVFRMPGKPIERKSKALRRKHRPDITHLVAANEKDTLSVTPSKTVDEKKKSLLGEATTDGNGNFEVKLSDKNYKGGAIEIAVYCETVPGQPKGKSKAKPVQFSITTIQPTWRETNDGMTAAWEYVIAYRFWCGILSMFDVWVICGKVVSCENPKIPIGGVDVTAMDADWIHDDKLGTATTDSSGHFKIYYTSKDFKKTFLSPVINVETPFPPYHSGPMFILKSCLQVEPSLLMKSVPMAKNRAGLMSAIVFALHSVCPYLAMTRTQPWKAHGLA